LALTAKCWPRRKIPKQKEEHGGIHHVSSGNNPGKHRAFTNLKKGDEDEWTDVTSAGGAERSYSMICREM